MDRASLEDFAREAEEFVSSLSEKDRRALADLLIRVLRLEDPVPPSDPERPVCPVCGSDRLVMYGRTAKGTQRWLCGDCGKVRCAGVGGIMLHTKLPPETWKAYVPLFIDHITSPKVAERLGVQQRTAWFMRIRTLEALYKNLPSFQLISGSAVQIDEIYFRESFKGTRFEDLEDPPREPHGEDSRGAMKKGISNDQICVVTGVSDSGDFFYDVACRGALTHEAAERSLQGRVGAGTLVVTDHHRSYAKVLGQMGVALHTAVEGREHGDLSHINHVHGAIRAFMRPFMGVSTKWLHLYMGWFKWLRVFDAGSRGAAPCLRQILSGNYDHTYRAIQARWPPFRDRQMGELKYSS